MFHVSQEVRPRFALEALDARRLLSADLPTDAPVEEGDQAAEAAIILDAAIDETIVGDPSEIFECQITMLEGPIDEGLETTLECGIFIPEEAPLPENEVVDPIPEEWYVLTIDDVKRGDDALVCELVDPPMGGSEIYEVQILTVDDEAAETQDDAASLPPPPGAAGSAGSDDSDSLARALLGSLGANVLA